MTTTVSPQMPFTISFRSPHPSGRYGLLPVASVSASLNRHNTVRTSKMPLRTLSARHQITKFGTHSPSKPLSARQNASDPIVKSP
jgi:hypothetical protein